MKLNSKKSKDLVGVFNSFRELRTNQAVRSVEHEIESKTRELSIQLSTFDKLQHDNLVFEKKNKELINEIALHIVRSFVIKLIIRMLRNY